MPKLELTNQQIVELVAQLPPEQKRDALLTLAQGASPRASQRMAAVESQIRRVCAERGLDWDKMSEDERGSFLDALVHEDRSCGT